MKTNRIGYSFGLLFLMLLLGICQLGCAKEPFPEIQSKNNLNSDTVLHNDSKYIAVIGDIQGYFINNVNMQYYIKTLQWISRHSNHISFVMHTGDVTDNNYVSEWENFYNITAPFAEIMPFYTCIGNHDYKCNAPDPWNHRDSTLFNEYVGFSSTVSHVEAWYENGKFENILVGESLFGDKSIYLLILELNPRRQVVNWADSIVKTLPDKNLILINHRYISSNAQRYQDLLYITDTLSSTAQDVWDNLIFENDNIRCVLCGHVSPLSRVLYSQNITGRVVPQIEFNIQKQLFCGNGLIELWEFDKNDNVYIRVYNTFTENFVNDTLTEFQFKF